jgi:hypothetical protein
MNSLSLAAIQYKVLARMPRASFDITPSPSPNCVQAQDRASLHTAVHENVGRADSGGEGPLRARAYTNHVRPLVPYGPMALFPRASRAVFAPQQPQARPERGDQAQRRRSLPTSSSDLRMGQRSQSRDSVGTDLGGCNRWWSGGPRPTAVLGSDLTAGSKGEPARRRSGFFGRLAKAASRRTSQDLLQEDEGSMAAAAASSASARDSQVRLRASATRRTAVYSSARRYKARHRPTPPSTVPWLRLQQSSARCASDRDCGMRADSRLTPCLSWLRNSWTFAAPQCAEGKPGPGCMPF